MLAMLYLAIAWYATGGLLISDYERRGKRTIDLPVLVKYAAWPVSLCIIAFTWGK